MTEQNKSDSSSDTGDEFQAIRGRDAESGAMWFTGPASFTAQAARDRRWLLAKMDADSREASEVKMRLWRERDEARGIIHDYEERAKAADQRECHDSGTEIGDKPRELARRFHDTYERLAPAFGYETRMDTRTFNPQSANGQLMTAVCAELFFGSDGEEVRSLLMGGAQLTQGGGDSTGMPLSVGRSRPDKTATISVHERRGGVFTFPDEPTPDRWQRIHSRDELEAFYRHILPRIRAAAKECGYAIAVHGSMRRDLDLIAAPWAADHADRDTLALAVSKAACSVGLDKFEWKEGEKPCGRVAVTLPICWCEWPDLPRDEKSTGCIDLSVMPDTMQESRSRSGIKIPPIDSASECNAVVNGRPADVLWRCTAKPCGTLFLSQPRRLINPPCPDCGCPSVLDSEESRGFSSEGPEA